jgi:phosphoribosylamine-glycine ligase
MKKALILGTGNAQVDLLRYLKEEGWWVIGCSYRREGKGLQYVDQFEQINITDISGIENLARSQNVDLIYSIGSDLAMPTIAKVSTELGLPMFVDYITASLLQNKVLFREFLMNHNISPVRHRMICSESDLAGWTYFPAIVKPADNQGQRGVFLANSIHEVRAQIESTLRLSRSGTVIIEEYLDGSEISVNAFVVDREVLFCEVSDRLVVEEFAGGIPKSHVLPAKTCSGELLLKTKELVNRCVHALSIENGPVYFQIKLTLEGPKIIEITPRLDGCHIWRLIKTVGNVDLLEASVRLLTGDKSIALQMSESLVASHLNFFLGPPDKEFKLADYPGPNDVSYLEYYYQDGETVRPINGALEKVGYYIERER